MSLIARQPAGRSRRQEYFDWAKQVVDRIADPPARLLALFKASYERRP
jgi:hypothetical protein